MLVNVFVCPKMIRIQLLIQRLDPVQMDLKERQENFSLLRQFYLYATSLCEDKFWFWYFEKIRYRVESTHSALIHLKNEVI